MIWENYICQKKAITEGYVSNGPPVLVVACAHRLVNVGNELRMLVVVHSNLLVIIDCGIPESPLSYIQHQPRPTHFRHGISASCKRRQPMSCGFNKAYTHGRGCAYMARDATNSMGHHQRPLCKNLVCANLAIDF